MKFQILEANERVHPDTGEVKRYIRALGQFSEYGTVHYSTVDIQIENEDLYKKLTQMIGKEVDLEPIFPKPSYPLKLV